MRELSNFLRLHVRKCVMACSDHTSLVVHDDGAAIGLPGKSIVLRLGLGEMSRNNKSVTDRTRANCHVRLIKIHSIGTSSSGRQDKQSHVEAKENIYT